MAEQPAPEQTVSTLRGREQWRAHYAMTAIANVPQAQRESYTRRAKSLPAMIQNLGLAGTIAFLLSKEASDQRLVRDLSEWLLSPEAGIGWAQAAVNAAEPLRFRLASAISHQQTSSLIYRRAATEAKHYATWIKRWSAASAGGEATAAPAEAGEVPGAPD